MLAHALPAFTLSTNTNLIISGWIWGFLPFHLLSMPGDKMRLHWTCLGKKEELEDLMSISS